MSLAACRHIVYLESCENFFFLPKQIPADMIDIIKQHSYNIIYYLKDCLVIQNMANKSVTK